MRHPRQSIVRGTSEKKKKKTKKNKKKRKKTKKKEKKKKKKKKVAARVSKEFHGPRRCSDGVQFRFRGLIEITGVTSAIAEGKECSDEQKTL